MDTVVTTNSEELAANLRQLIAGSEELMESIRREGGNQYDEVMKRVNHDIEQAREQLGELKHDLAARTRAARRRADELVSAHPWEAAGTAAAAGALLGVAMGVLIVRSASR